MPSLLVGETGKMTQKTMIHNFTEGNIPKQMLRFTGPFILANILQTAYNIVDMIVIGQFVGANGLSAVSIGGQITTLVTFVGIGFATTGQVMISQYVGKNNRPAISRTVGTMLTLIQALSLVLTVAGILLIDPIIRWLNTPLEAVAQTRDYMLVCFLGMFFIFGYNAVSSILRGMGDSRRPLVFIAIASLMNLVLDLYFVAVLHWAAFGTALATVMGQAVSFIVAIIYLYRRRESFGFDFRLSSFRPSKDIVYPMLKMGIPMTLQSIAISLSMTIVGAFVNAYGVVAAAVGGVGQKLGMISGIITQSIAAASTTMIGQNLAGRKIDRVNRIVGIALLINMSFAVLVSLAMIFFCKEIFSIFNREPEVLEMGRLYILPFVLGTLAMASMSPFNALINGLGYASLAFGIAILDGVVARLGLALLFGRVLGMGVQGFWLGRQLAGFVTTLIAGGYYLSGRWKTRQLLIREEEPSAET
mgnify:CR=1 FL=1